MEPVLGLRVSGYRTPGPDRVGLAPDEAPVDGADPVLFHERKRILKRAFISASAGQIFRTDHGASVGQDRHGEILHTYELCPGIGVEVFPGTVTVVGVDVRHREGDFSECGVVAVGRVDAYGDRLYGLLSAYPLDRLGQQFGNDVFACRGSRCV